MADGESFIEGEILVADIVPTNSSRRELNLSALSTIAVSVVFLLLAVSFGEAIVGSLNEELEEYEWWETPLHLRHTMELPMNDTRAKLPVEGIYNATEYTEHFIEVDLPASEQDAGFPEPAVMHVALWLPDVLFAN